LPPFVVFDARVTAGFSTAFGRADVALFVENLGGSEYVVVSGYPMPPRHARLRITLTV
jgi:hypothetical protein